MQQTKRARVSVSQKIIIGLIINTIFTLIEFAAGYFSSSLALISDASNNLCDVISLCNSLMAQKITQKTPTVTKTFGYARITLLSVLINTVILFSLAIVLIYTAINKIIAPEPLDGSIVIIMGALGIIINGGVALSLRNHTQDISIKSSYINLLVDAVASAGAVYAGLIIMLTGWLWVDAAVSLAIASFLLFNALRLAYQVLHIFFDGVPNHISMPALKKEILSIPWIDDIIDIHVWSNSNQTLLTCTLSVNPEDAPKAHMQLSEFKMKIQRDFRIDHSTIELSCDPHFVPACAQKEYIFNRSRNTHTPTQMDAQ